MNQPKFPLKAPAKFDPSMFLALYGFIKHQYGRVRRLIRADLRGMAEFQPWVEPINGTKRGEMEVARERCNNRNIIFKSVDKSSKIVIMDKQQYILEANRQLANTKCYKPIKDSIQKNT